MPEPRVNAEFDNYAIGGYLGGMEDPIKRAFGANLDQFLLTKVRWLLEHVKPSTSEKLLDFGCGNGQFLQLLRREGYNGALFGADVSQGMLNELERRWHDSCPPTWTHFTPNEPLTHPNGQFDLAVVCCVFHHIPKVERLGAARELRRLVAPGGRVMIFEHNPFNPMTQLIVSRAEIDRDAVLLSARETRQLFRAAGFQSCRTKYLMFAPPKFRSAKTIDRLLSWCPLGAQYVVEAK